MKYECTTLSFFCSLDDEGDEEEDDSPTVEPVVEIKLSWLFKHCGDIYDLLLAAATLSCLVMGW